MALVETDGWGKGFLASHWHYYKSGHDETAICGFLSLPPKGLYSDVPEHRRQDRKCSCCKGRSSNNYYTNLRLDHQQHQAIHNAYTEIGEKLTP